MSPLHLGMMLAYGLLLGLVLSWLLGTRRELEGFAERADAAQRYVQALLEASPVPIAVIDAGGIVQMVNPAGQEMFGRTSSELVDRSAFELIGPGGLVPADDPGRVQALLGRALDGARLSEVEVRLHDRAGEPRDVTAYSAPVLDAAGEIDAAVICWVDITERKRHEAEIEHLATHDPMTGLPNRWLLEQSLTQAVGRAARGHQSALVLIDFDNFKLVNDAAGHGVGDRVLTGVAEVMREALRPGDLLARMGGDEFGALIYDVSLDEAQAIASRLVRRVGATRFSEGGHTFDPTVSAGVCLVDGDADGDEVLRRADVALFAAKDLGRNRVLLSDDERVVELTLAGRWYGQIKDAILGDRLLLALQPVVSLEDGEAVYHEALVRMRQEDGTVILPDTFLPAAEQLGLMPEIDAWVVKTAFELLRRQPDRRLLVNLSAASFEDDALLDLLETELRDGIEPGRVGVEITEAAALQGYPRAAKRFEKLKGFGCLLALDDFGSGFSSFSRLRALPIDLLKIDGSLTRGIDTDATSRGIVQAITRLGEALAIDVIAEEVETEAVALILRDLGVRYAQGFCWGRPHPVEQPAEPAPMNELVA